MKKIAYLAIGLLIPFEFSCKADVASQITQSVTHAMVRATSEGVNQNIKYQMYKPELRVHNSTGGIDKINLSSNGNFLAVSTKDGGVHVWDLVSGVRRLKINPIEKTSSLALYTDEKGEGILLIGSENGTLQAIDINTTISLCTANLAGKSVSASALSSDGKYLAAAYGSNNIRVYETKNCRIITEFKNESRVTLMVFSSDGKKLLTGDENNNVIEWGVTNNKQNDLGQLGSGLLSISYLNASEQAVAITDRGIEKVNARNQIRFESLKINSAQLSDRGVGVFASAGGEIKIVDVSNNELIGKINVGSTQIRQVAYLAESKKILTTDDGGEIHLWEPISGREQLKIVITQNGWAVIDTNGRFDASEQGMQDVAWDANKNEYSLSNLSKAFFEPGLLGDYAQGRMIKLEQKTDKFADGMALPPKVEIDFSDDEIEGVDNVKLRSVVIVATDQGGGIGELRLYHNGKLVGPTALVKTEDVDVDNKHLRVAGYAVNPVNGLNTFVAAGSGLWDIEGYSDKVVRTVNGESDISSLHIFTVGINSYLDSRMNLNYSVQDADATAQEIKRFSQKYFKEVKEYSIRDALATNANIKRDIAKLVELAKDEDVVVFYFAGHGLVAGDEWHFMPYDTIFGSSEDDYRNTGITSSELQNLLVKSKAKRMLLLIDACQSGATTESFRNQQQFQRKFLRDISKVAGITVIAASRRDQNAIEAKTLGHGLFTYEIIDGLKGHADLSPIDNKISAHELADFVAQNLPQMSYKFAKYFQQPMSYRLGADFILGSVE